MTCSRTADVHTDSGYRRMMEVDDVKGYGMRGLCMLRRGICRSTKIQMVHLLESICRSHKLIIRSSYGAEALAAAHGLDDVYPTIITLEELRHGIMSKAQLKDYRETGGLHYKVILTMEDIFKKKQVKWRGPATRARGDTRE